MQEWNLQGGGRRSSSTETPFSDGQSVRSVLCLSEEGGIERLDFALDENITLGECRPIAQWVRVFRSNQAEQAVRREAVETAEGLFVDLIDEGSSKIGNGDEDPGSMKIRGALIFLLALHLERKRVLRPIGRIAPDGSQNYRHPKADREYKIEPAQVSNEMLGKIQDQIALVLD